MNKSWRGTVLFTVILVVMGATVGLKLYGLGTDTISAQTAVHPATTSASSPSSSGDDESSTSGSTGTGSASSSTPSAGATPSPSASASTASVTGAAVDTPYGPVQVKLTFSGTTITAVETVQYPNGSGRDLEINQQAVPILQQEVMQSQSAHIDSVSGATYTSEGYIQSVQSAIDRH